MKYVIIKADLNDVTRYFGFVFSERWTHSDFAEHVEDMIASERTGSKTNWFRTYKNVSVFSAGFCGIRDNAYEISRHGSESLHIKENDALESRDESILNMPEAFNGDITLYAMLPKIGL